MLTSDIQFQSSGFMVTISLMSSILMFILLPKLK